MNAHFSPLSPNYYHTEYCYSLLSYLWFFTVTVSSPAQAAAAPIADGDTNGSDHRSSRSHKRGPSLSEPVVVIEPLQPDVSF